LLSDEIFLFPAYVSMMELLASNIIYHLLIPSYYISIGNFL